MTLLAVSDAWAVLGAAIAGGVLSLAGGLVGAKAAATAAARRDRKQRLDADLVEIQQSLDGLYQSIRRQVWAANSSEERNAAAWNVQGLVLRLQSGIVRIGDEILLEQLRAHLKMITDIQAGRTNDFHTLAEHTLQMHIRIGALLQET